MLMKSVRLTVLVPCLILCGVTGVLPQSVFGGKLDSGFLVSELLRSPLVEDSEDIWSITVIDSPDAQQLHVRIMSKPVGSAGGVCESRVRFYVFDDVERAWVLESSRQGIRMTDTTNGCDYSLDANSFALVSGGRIDSGTFLQLQHIASEEQSELNQLGSQEFVWLDSIPNIVYDAQSSIIELRYLSDGCVLTLSFNIDSIARPTLQDYSTSNVHCIRK